MAQVPKSKKIEKKKTQKKKTKGKKSNFVDLAF